MEYILLSVGNHVFLPLEINTRFLFMLYCFYIHPLLLGITFIYLIAASFALVSALQPITLLLTDNSLLYTKPLSGLKTILLLLDDDNEDNDSQEEGTKEDEENDDQRTQSQDEELRKRADELREECADFLEHKGGTWPNVLYMNRTGTIY